MKIVFVAPDTLINIQMTMFLFVALFAGSLFTNKRVSIRHTNNLFVFTDAKKDTKISPIFANYGMWGASLGGV